MAPQAEALRLAPTPNISEISNTEALGRILYTQYVYVFQAAGIVLLVAMIGSIVLTLRRRPGVRKQDISVQVHRRKEDTVEVVKVPVGKGIA
jgi:NADH-quinone oxidoreductase subunit J